MEPKKVGRALGIGVRVASRMVQERVAEASAQQSSQKTAPASARLAPPTTQNRANTGNRVATAQKGLRAFRQAFLGPFTHAGSILWLEITGMFFALFALFFVQNVYHARNSWRAGPDHGRLLLYVGLALAFSWFSVSSFLRARRKSKRGR